MFLVVAWPVGRLLYNLFVISVLFARVAVCLCFFSVLSFLFASSFLIFHQFHDFATVLFSQWSQCVVLDCDSLQGMLKMEAHNDVLPCKRSPIWSNEFPIVVMAMKHSDIVTNSSRCLHNAVLTSSDCIKIIKQLFLPHIAGCPPYRSI